MRVDFTGDWRIAERTLRRLGRRGTLVSAFKVTIDECGELIRERLIGHIDSEDLGWKPLSSRTIALKGNSKIYVESGTLKDNIKVERINSGDYSIFIGSGGTNEPRTGKSTKDVLVLMEYGTSKMPARPLVRPTWEELKPIIKDRMRNTITRLLVR